MAMAKMELSVALVVPPVVEHVGEGRLEETVPTTRAATVVQPVVTPPLQAGTATPDLGRSSLRAFHRREVRPRSGLAQHCPDQVGRPILLGGHSFRP
jgi:hypothetical protein